MARSDQGVLALEFRPSPGFRAGVQGWFRENGVEYLRAYPSSMLGEEPPSAAELFAPTQDAWGFEQILVQLGWAARLGHEGGLFVTIGRT